MLEELTQDIVNETMDEVRSSPNDALAVAVGYMALAETVRLNPDAVDPAVKKFIVSVALIALRVIDGPQ